MENAVVIRDVSKSFGDVQALDGVSLEIPKGSMYALMGADGSGRTTLFRLMASLMVPDRGSITVEGIDAVRNPMKIREIIGYMPGKFSLYGDLTVEENLKFFASLYGVSVEENRYLVDEIYTQIEPFKNRRAAKLSGGMKQKLALSCALIHAPKLLFLDEPTTGVDPVSRKELWDMLSRLRDRGITIIASTPYLDEVRRCSQAALIEHGKIAAVGTADEIASKFEVGSLGNSQSQKDSGPIIKIEHLVKKFGDFRAVDDISFEVMKGEIFGFLGANGAGKTTAMKIICGLSNPSEGGGTVAGYDVATQPEQIKKHIGYMSQKFCLYDDLTIRENLELFANIYRIPKKEIQPRCDEMLEMIGFTDMADRMAGTLPVGWKQRLSFAVSLVHNPKIVFLDEPTGGVDPLTRKEFWKMIYKAAARGTTFFVTTHYMDEAAYCDRISIMVDGKIEALGAPEELVSKFGAKDMDEVFQMLARKTHRVE